MTLKNITILLLTLLAIALSLWSILTSSSSFISTKQADPKTPDSYMQDVVAIFFNKEGTPSLKVVTPKMVHYPENNLTHIIAPRVVVYRKSPQPWYIDSDYANAKNGVDEILFWSNVYIHHPADTENPTTTLNTTSLTIFPEQKLASTNDPIIFTQPDTTVHAVGMQANLDIGTIKLLSQTKGEYVPTS